MPKKLIRRYLPGLEQIKEHKNLQFMGDKLHDPNLWHLNRRSVSRACAIGLFVAWIPAPGQMIIAASSALYFRANLAIAVALVWLTNPFTWLPLFYFAYHLGLWSLDKPVPGKDLALTADNILHSLHSFGIPLLLGCVMLGVLCSVFGYYGSRYFWIWRVRRQWQHRQQARENK